MKGKEQQRMGKRYERTIYERMEERYDKDERDGSNERVRTKTVIGVRLIKCEREKGNKEETYNKVIHHKRFDQIKREISSRKMINHPNLQLYETMESKTKSTFFLNLLMVVNFSIKLLIMGD